MTSEIQSIYEHRKLNWAIISVLVVLHAGAIAALFMFSWHALIISILLYWASVGWASAWVTIGCTRTVPTVCPRVRIFSGFLRNSVARRRAHLLGGHASHSSPVFRQARRPAFPRDGAWWSHIGWLLTGESKHNDTKLMAKYAPDLARDPYYAHLNTYHWIPIIVVSALLLIFGGLPLLLWATCMRLTLACTPPGLSTPSRTCGAPAASPRAMIPATMS